LGSSVKIKSCTVILSASVLPLVRAPASGGRGLPERLIRVLCLSGAIHQRHSVAQAIRHVIARSGRFASRQDLVHSAIESQGMSSFVIAFEKRIRSDATAKLKEVMKSTPSLETDESLLDDH